MLQKLEKTLFFIFLILIPFQIRIFLVNSGEWNSIFVYLGDVILAGVIGLWIYRTYMSSRTNSTNVIKDIFGGSTSEKRSNLLLLVFLIIAFISIFVSSATKISAFRWLKLVEFVLIFAYIRARLRTLNLEFRTILQIIIYSGLFQAILAIAQFIKQGSIGIKFIEAGVFRPDTPGVANFILNGEKIMRSYGSFSHPNVLSGFLLLTIFCLYYLLINPNIPPTPRLRRASKIQKLVLFISLPVLIFGLFLTFSRATILVFLFGSLAMFLFEFFKLRKLEHTEQRLKDGKNLIKLFVLVIVSCVLVIVILFPYVKARFFTISLQEQAIDLRFFYNRIALSMIKDKPILGIGIGNFVNYSHNYSIFLRAAANVAGVDANQIPDWIFQPEHNIYLLIASEIGILGLIVFMAILITNGIRIIRRINPLTILFVGFLIIALSDHYFWTLQSGAIMFWLAFALIRE